MKQLRLLLTIFLLCVGGMNAVFAQSGWSTNTYEADGIRYYLNNATREAKVAIGNYSGEIVIPEYIWPEHPGNQDAIVQMNNPYWGGYRVTDYVYENNSGSIQTPFSNNTNITKVVLPQSIRAIKDGTFQNCTQLEEVRLIGCFFTNSYSTDTNSPIGTHSSNVFSGCTSLRRLYADDPRVVCVRHRFNVDTGKYENYCPLVNVLGTNTTTNLSLYHNAGVALASYFPNRMIKQEQKTFANSKLKVTVDFFPNGNVSYIDYGYTLNSLYACNVTETSQPITNREVSIDCPKQGSKTFVLKNVPEVTSPAYLKPYIQVGDADPVPMCIFGDTFYYTVYANPDANSNTNVRIMYLSPTTWGAGLAVETPGNITVYVDNKQKISDYQDAGTYNVANPQYPFSTYELALDFDTLRYVVKAFDANNNEYPLQKLYGGYINGAYSKGKYYFRTTGSASYLDYRVRLTATDIPMQIWYFDKPAGAKLTVSCSRKGIPYTFTYKNSTNCFSADPEKPITLKLENVRDGVIPYIIAARERLELQEGINSDGTKYYEASYVPHYGEYNDIQIGTTQIIENGTLLSVNITKVGNGYVWIYETNDWYEAVDENNPERLEDMETDGETQNFEWMYDIDDIQTLKFVVPISESTNGIVETVRVNVNGVDIESYHSEESGNHDGEMWYYYKVPINEDLDIQLIHETNARHLTVKNGDGSGEIAIYNPDDERVLSVSTNLTSSGEYLVRQMGYYAIIQPKAGKEVSAIFTTGMQQLLPPADYLQGDGIYLVPLAGFETNTIDDYQLSVLYVDGAVDPWISYHHEGPIGSLGSLVNSLPESQKNAIEQLSVDMQMRAKDLAAIRYLGGKPDYYTKPDTQGSLYSLDLTDAVFYEGDEVFYTDESREYKINTRNVMPQGFLEGLHLETLYLPKALLGFEEGALINDVNNHLEVYAPWKTPLDLSTSSGFGDEVAQMDLFVPAGSFDAYAADAEWSKFGFIWEYGTIEPETIQFADNEVKRICVANWDTDGDGELSKQEAEAVTTLKADHGDGTYGDPAFKDNTAITSFDELKYFTGLTSIESGTFNGCTNLKTVVVPEGVETIADEAFKGCTELLTVSLPDGLTKIGNFAFQSAKKLFAIRLPETLTEIETYAFRYCSSLRSVVLPANIQKLGTGAFMLTGLNTLNIPAKVTSVGETAVCGSSLLSVSVASGNTKYNSADNCNAIINSSTHELISGSKFAKIPEGVLKIGRYAFAYLTIDELEIPSSVGFIDFAAFTQTQLESIVCKGTTPPELGDSPFAYMLSNCKLTVPRGTRDAYIAAGWTEDIFKGGVVEAEPEPVNYDLNSDSKIDIGDVTKLVNEVLKQSKP